MRDNIAHCVKKHDRKNNCNSCINTKLQESVILANDHAMNADCSLKFTFLLNYY